MKTLLFSITKKDLEISYFSGSGGGGQHRNKHQNCVRIKHIESGGMAVGQSHKSRQQNIKEALTNLVKSGKFKVWHLRKTHEIIEGKTIEAEVEEMMDTKNLKVECRNKETNQWEFYNVN